MLTCDHPIPPDRYNDSVEEHLRVTEFYHASQIGVVQCQKVLVNALIERWHPDTHTFHLPIGECVVTLEDVALILGLPTDGLPVTGMTMSSFEALEAECLLQFRVAPRKSDCRGSCIKLTWLRDLKENLELTDETVYRGHLVLIFVWVAYAVDRVDPSIIPAEIYMQSVVWSATGVPNQERNMDKAHGEDLTGPKNLNWATASSHSIWVMHWTNRYNYILFELPIPSQHPLDSYMYWYRSKFGDHLNLSNLVGQENDEGNQDMDEGNQDTDEGSQDMDDDNEEQEPHSPHISPPNPLPHEQPQFSSQYVPQTHKLCLYQARTPNDKAKCYNMRIDPPHRSANRYTPSVLKKAAKKCKNFVKDIKWAIRK
ncbi:uncharacterized protein DS421_19g643340 [Arachis hypogaea]|uniref:Aminotransferase-like plant mobile domain-containing protein n=1 Tax=Arachis hypogaea TaxID=3818 RepID=A0A6B9V5T2_ARAHY|nr:uncharacterized protein DS421_19g643340 [Arachis hypogaea]